MLAVTIDASGLTPTIRGLAEITANPEPILLIAMQVGQSSTQMHFVNFGPGWAPRSPLTEKILMHKYGYVKGVLMRLTTGLANATGLGGKTGEDGAIEINAGSAYLINRKSYAAKMQYGDPGGEPYIEMVKEHQRVSSKGRAYTVAAHQRNAVTRPIPPRPFMYWSEEDAQDIEVEVLNYLERKMRGN